MAQLDLCGASISGNVTIDCDNIITPGLEQVGVIFNRNDIADWSEDDTNNSIIDGIIMKKKINPETGQPTTEDRKGYVIYQMGSQPFNGTSVAFAEGSIVNTFTNTCSFVILNNGPEVCHDIIDNLANGSFVVLFKNKFSEKDDNGNHPGLWQIMGKETGLKASEISCDKYSDDTNSGWQITLTEEKATKSALFFFKNNDTTTDEEVQGLTEMTW